MLKPVLLISAVMLALGAVASADTVDRPTRIEIFTSIDLPATPEAVWAVLSDLKSYPDWNPYHVSVDGKLALGERLEVKIEKPNGKKVAIEPHVLEIDQNRSLVWGGGPWGLFRGEHRFDLELLSPGCTRLHHTEVFSGLFVSFADLSAIEPGYHQMNRALLTRLQDSGLAPRSCGLPGNPPMHSTR